MRDVKEMYSELLASCSEDGNINTDAFSKHLQDMDPAERKVLLAWVFNTLAKAVGSVFTKAATVIGDALQSPYEATNKVHVINFTQMFESFSEDYANPFVFEDGLLGALSQAFVKGKWPVNAAPFSEVSIAVSAGRIRYNHRPGTELLILGSYSDVVNAEWKDPSFGAMVKEIMNLMGYTDTAGYPGWLVVYSGQKGLTGELKQAEEKTDE